MKKACLVFLALLATVFCASAQNDDFGTWTDIQCSHSWDRIYTSLRMEYRSKGDATATDLWFVRPTLGVKLTPWLKADIAYDLMGKPSGMLHRGLFSLTATLRQGPLSVSVRERYILGYNVAGNTISHVLRSQLKAQYAIPGSRFAPYLAVELFIWEHWQKTRHYVGTDLEVQDWLTLDIFYLYHTIDGQPAQHIAGLGAHFKI